jgi:hypothetical protein
MWDAVIESFSAHRTLLVASIEAAVQAEHSAGLRGRLAGGQEQGRRGLAAILGGPAADGRGTTGPEGASRGQGEGARPE